MKASTNNIHLKQILVIALTSIFSFSIFIDKALSGGGDTTQTTTTGNSSVTSPTVQNAGSLTVTPTTLLQTGTNNYANVNSSTYGSLIFREGDQIVREGEYKSQEEN